MKLRSINQKTPDIVAMKDMKPGQVGVVVGDYHGGMLVGCFGDDLCRCVVALDRSNVFWYTCINTNEILVQLHKSGTKLEFEV